MFLIKKCHLHTHKIAGLIRALSDNDGLPNPLIKPHLLRGGWHWGKHPLKLPWSCWVSTQVPPRLRGGENTCSLYFFAGEEMLNINELHHPYLLYQKKDLILFWFLVANIILETDLFGGMKIHIFACRRFFVWKKQFRSGCCLKDIIRLQKKHASQTKSGKSSKQDDHTKK